MKILNVIAVIFCGCSLAGGCNSVTRSESKPPLPTATEQKKILDQKIESIQNDPKIPADKKILAIQDARMKATAENDRAAKAINAAP